MNGNKKDVAVSDVSELDTLLDGLDNDEETKVTPGTVDVEDDESKTPEPKPKLSDEDEDEDDNEDLDTDDEDLDDDETDKPKKKKEEEEDEESKVVKNQPKDNHAFAAMRKENSKLKEAIDNLARGLGIDPKDDTSLDQLSDLAVKGIAKREGKTKEEVIADSKAQRELSAYRQRDIQTHAKSSLEKIKEEFGVDQKRLASFVGKLTSQGYDLLSQKADWEGMYKNMYFDEIVQKQVDSAVEEALKRDKAADNNSGKSKKKRGKLSNSKTEVSSMSELNKLLDEIG